jgi:hypothetical protein
MENLRKNILSFIIDTNSLFGESSSLTNKEHLNPYRFYYNSRLMFVSIKYLDFLFNTRFDLKHNKH